MRTNLQFSGEFPRIPIGTGTGQVSIEQLYDIAGQVSRESRQNVAITKYQELQAAVFPPLGQQITFDKTNEDTFATVRVQGDKGDALFYEALQEALGSEGKPLKRVEWRRDTENTHNFLAHYNYHRVLAKAGRKDYL